MQDQDPLNALLEFIPRGGRLLVLGPDLSGHFQEAQAWITAAAAMRHIHLESRSTGIQDPRLMTLARESWDAIYWDASPIEDAGVYPLEQVQRVLLSCFQALRPARGTLALSAPQSCWDENAIQSLIRQSGYRLLGTWNSDAADQRLWLLQRI